MRRASSRVIPQSDSQALGQAALVLSKGGFVVAPTDTIYGILADATNPEAVLKLYKLRRPSRKPFIVLLPDLSWLGKLGLQQSRKTLKLLNIPALTVVLRKETGLFHYLGRHTLAVRYPRRGFVYKLLKRFDRPVVAPSANLEGESPAETVEEALRYFGNSVDLYVDGGKIKGKPSVIVNLVNGLKVLRYGTLSERSLKEILGKIKLLSPYRD